MFFQQQLRVQQTDLRRERKSIRGDGLDRHGNGRPHRWSAAAICGAPAVRSTITVSIEAISADAFSFSPEISLLYAELLLEKHPVSAGHSTIHRSSDSCTRCPNMESYA